MQEESLQIRLATLEIQQKANQDFCFILLVLILRQNDGLWSDVADTILNILKHPIPSLTDSEQLRDLLRMLRSSLISPPDAEMSAIFSQSHIRPVE